MLRPTIEPIGLAGLVIAAAVACPSKYLLVWRGRHIFNPAAVGATVALTAAAVGSIVNSVPVGCAPVNYGGAYYQQCGSVWYEPQGYQYLVVNPPY